MMHTNSLRAFVLFVPLLVATACRQPPADSHDQALESLVDTERAFANTSVTTTTRNAFLEYLAEDGILFNDGPVNGRELWERRPDGGAVLKWAPEIADVAAAGDMGFTSGPWEIRAAPGESPVGWGHFVTVWRKDSTGTWKVAVDGGNTHDSVLVVEGGDVRFLGGDDPDPPTDHVRQGTARSSLTALNRAYSRSVAESGFSSSLDSYVDPEARFYRNGHLPIVGLDAALGTATVTGSVWSESEQRGVDVSESGDLGFTFGVLESPSGETGTDTIHFASYFRIWKRRGASSWKVIVDVLIPFVPASE